MQPDDFVNVALVCMPNRYHDYFIMNVHYHVLQTQGYIEHFRDSCGGVIAWLDSVTHYAAINVGWAYYAEYQLIGQDTGTYDNEPMQKYGMLKWRVRQTKVHKETAYVF